MNFITLLSLEYFFSSIDTPTFTTASLITTDFFSTIQILNDFLNLTSSTLFIPTYNANLPMYNFYNNFYHIYLSQTISFYIKKFKSYYSQRVGTRDVYTSLLVIRNFNVFDIPIRVRNFTFYYENYNHVEKTANGFLPFAYRTTNISKPYIMAECDMLLDDFLTYYTELQQNTIWEIWNNGFMFFKTKLEILNFAGITYFDSVIITFRVYGYLA